MMKSAESRLSAAPIAAALATLSFGLSAQAQISSGPDHLTIERITKRPLEGTPPINPVWSPDSNHVAFLWDDTGTGDRNIWVAAARGGEPRRITDLARQMPARPSGPISADQMREGAMLVVRAGLIDMQSGGVASLMWAPDSTALIMSHQGELWRVPNNGSAQTRLTDSTAPRTALAFSPDARFLSFLQGGSLWFRNVATGELTQPAKTNGNVRFSAYQWSPDGRTIALVFHEPSGRAMPTTIIPNFLTEDVTLTRVRRQTVEDEGGQTGRSGIALLNIADGQVRLFEPDGRRSHRVNEFHWSPDGRRVLVDEFSFDTVHRWLWLVDARDGSIRELLHDERATRVTPFWHSAWRTDGQAVIYLTNSDGWHHIYSMALDGGTPVLLTAGEFEIVGEGLASNMDLIRATRELFFVSTEQGPAERQVYRMSERGGPIKRVTTLPGVHRPVVAPNGRYVATLRDADEAPMDLYITDVRSGAPERRITRSPLSEFYELQLITPRYIVFKSHVDGDEIRGRLLEPANLDRSKRYPVILGPVYRDTARNSWGGMLEQYLAREGEYIQLKIDMRGSIGYGRVFQEKIFKNVGGIEADDLESAVRYLTTLPYVDPDRIGIYGASYGGLATLMAVFKKPTLFKAAVAQCPASNLWHGPGLRYARTPQENPEAYRNASPISFGEDLQARLMIIHGTQDPNVLFQDTLKLVERLVTLGKNFDFVLVPSAGHCDGPNVNQSYFTTTKLVEHFERFLGSGPRPGGSNE